MSVEPGRQGAGGKVRILSACHIGEWSTSAGKQPARYAVLKRYYVRQFDRYWPKADIPFCTANVRFRAESGSCIGPKAFPRDGPPLRARIH
jgi:hypothetical protein